MIKQPNPFYTRNMQILAAYGKGLSLAVIGKKHKLTRERTRQIIMRGTPPQFYLREHIVNSWRTKGREYVRNLVRTRDKQTCQKCKRKWKKGERAFDVHHINNKCGKKSRKYDHVGDMDGLITWCHRCHMRNHTVKVSESKAYKQSSAIKKHKLGEMRRDLMVKARELGAGLDDIGVMFNIKQSRVSHIIKK